MNTWIVGKGLMRLHFQIKKTFYSKLYLKNIADGDYIHAQKVFNEFEIKSLGQYDMIYMFKVIHYCLHMYLKTLEPNVLKYMNLILLIFYLQLG